MKIHWIELNNIHEMYTWIPPDTCIIINPFDISVLRKHGYIGESAEMVTTEEEVIVFNDFYDIQYIQWDKFAEYAKKRGDCEFYIVKYPRREKFQILPFKEIHRDGSVIIKWKKKTNKRIKV